jgi:hypothetical protein
MPLQRALQAALDAAVASTALEGPPDIACVFVAGVREWTVLGRVPSMLERALKNSDALNSRIQIVGCTVVPDAAVPTDGDVSVEIVLASLPGICVHTFRVGQEDRPLSLDW